MEAIDTVDDVPVDSLFSMVKKSFVLMTCHLNIGQIHIHNMATRKRLSLDCAFEDDSLTCMIVCSV